MSWSKKNLYKTTSPRQHGKGLAANYSDKRCYRVGLYRILANIHADDIVIEVVAVGHRKEIY